jgi:hypothetical protein
MKTTIKLVCLLVAALILLAGCGDSKSNARTQAGPAPDVSKALAYKVARDEAGPIGNTGYIIAERWVVVDPGASDHTALAQTAIKAALEGLAKYKSNSCRVFVIVSPADIGAGRHLARAMYVPSGKGPDGAAIKRWQVEAALKGRASGQ